MKYEILNRCTGEVQFVAEIECEETAPKSLKVGLSVKWGVKHSANLRNANLRNANLRSADLRSADLWSTDLSNADLLNANLSNADLRNADIWNADLRGAYLMDATLWNADLRSADLRSANLRNANLRSADLRSADLWSTDLSNADLWSTDLSNADLLNANLWNAHGVNKYIKCIQVDTYAISYTDTVMQIGCENHLISEWADFDDERIIEMDGKTALMFWRKYKTWIFNTIELCPALPTKQDDEVSR